MPNKYNTGGKVSGNNGKYLPGAGAEAVDVLAAGMGTTYHQPNVKLDSPPGGYGSTGKASDSTPTKKGK